MEQQPIKAGEVIEVDYNRPGIPHTVKLLQPSFSKTQHGYVCKLETTRSTPNAVVGNGETIEAAATDWDKQLTQRLSTGDATDEIVQLMNEAIKPVAAENSEQLKVQENQHNHLKSVTTDSNVEVDDPLEAQTYRRNTADQSNSNGSE